MTTESPPPAPAADAEPIAWMYESEHSCAGPFTERRVTFSLDRWSAVPHKHKETPLYAARERARAPDDVAGLIARLNGAYSTVFERSLAKEAAAALVQMQRERDALRKLLREALGADLGFDQAWVDAARAKIDATPPLDSEIQSLSRNAR